MIVVRDSLLFSDKARVHKRDLWQGSRSAVREEIGNRTRDGNVLRAPQGEEWKVAEVIAGRDGMLGQAIPDCWQGRNRKQRVVQSIGLRGVLVNSIRISPRQDGGEVFVTGRPARGSAAQ